MKRLLIGLLFLAACRTGAPPAVRPYLAAISVPNLDQAIDWYRTNLDFQLLSRNDYPDAQLSIAILERDSFRLELVRHDKAVARPGDNPALLYGFGKLAFWVDDVDRWLARFRRGGATFQLEPRDNAAQGTRSFIVLDPAGTWIQITGLRAG